MLCCFDNIETQVVPFDEEKEDEICQKYILKFYGITECINGIIGSSATVFIYKNDSAIWCSTIKLDGVTNELDAIYKGLLIGIERAIFLKIQTIIVETSNNTIIDHMSYSIHTKQYPHKDFYKVKILEKQFGKISYKHIPLTKNYKTYKYDIRMARNTNK